MRRLETYMTQVVDLNTTIGSFQRSYPAFTNEWSIVQPYPAPVRHISLPEIVEIMPAMENGVSELKGAITNGVYTVLVGDDTSGRIPTLILRGVISHINQSYGRPPVPAIFVKGMYDGLSSSDRKRLAQSMRTFPTRPEEQRALIVTEYIDGGAHVKGIGDVIHAAGIEYDIFAVGRPWATDFYRKADVLLNSENIFPSANYSNTCPQLHSNPRLSGYERVTGGAVKFNPAFRDVFNEARKGVQTAVAVLVKNNFLKTI